MANLINLERATVGYGTRTLLDGVSLGIDEGDAIGVVGRNGDGKTTLLKILTATRPPDSGRVTHVSGLSVGYLHQSDDFHPEATVRDVIVDGRADHIWAADAETRSVVENLLTEVAMDREVNNLSGGERRRVALAAILLAGSRRSGAGRTDEPPRRRGHRMAGRAPLQADGQDAGGRQPRPVVPGRGVYPDLGGARRNHRRLRGRLRGLRPGQGGTFADRRGYRGAPTEPDAQGTGVAAEGTARADVEAEVPHSGGQRSDRQRTGATRLPCAATLCDGSTGQGRVRPAPRDPAGG